MRSNIGTTTLNQFLESNFWAFAVCLSLLKLYLCSDSQLFIEVGAADSALYVKRAFHLLQGDALGPYHATLLFKLPGISFFIAAMRTIGVPYLLGLHFLYIFSGLYFVAALRRTGWGVYPALLFLLFFLLHPYTFSFSWEIVQRENIEVPLLILLGGSLVFIFWKDRPCFHSIVAYSTCLSFLAVLREEGRVYLLFIPITLIAANFHTQKKRTFLRLGIGLFVIPTLFWITLEVTMRQFIKRHYGVPIVHELSEGNFPKLITALRSMKKERDNRLIPVGYQNLRQLAEIDDNFGKILLWMDKMQLPHSAEGCSRLGICDEFLGPDLFLSLKRAAHHMGLTPNATDAQKLFKAMSDSILVYCTDGRLDCDFEQGRGLLPNFHLKWLRPFFYGILGKFFHFPWTRYQSPPSSSPTQANVNQTRMWQYTTMASYADTLSIEDQRTIKRWGNYSPEIFENLAYWMRYPEVATSQRHGIHWPTRRLGGKAHFEDIGASSGYEWRESKNRSTKIPTRKEPNFLFESLYFFAIGAAILFSVLILVYRWLMTQKAPNSSLDRTVTVIFCFIFLKILVLSYVDLFLWVPPRLYYSVHVLASVFGVAFTTSTIRDLITNQNSPARQ